MLNVELFSAVLHVAVFVVGVSSFRFFLCSCFTGVTSCSFIWFVFGRLCLPIEGLRLEDGCALTLHVFRQVEDVLSCFLIRVTLHEVKERAQNAEARRNILVGVIIEECGQQMYQSGGKELFFADVADMFNIWIH